MIGGLVLTSFAAVATLSGCGGGGSTASLPSSTLGASARSSAAVKIIWPSTTATGSAKPRLIPAAANSIVISFTQSGTVVSTQTVARPTTGTTSTTTFASLPVGTLTVKADAHPNADGSGVTQATASTSVAIVSGQTTPVSINMASTIDHLVISPTTPTATVGATTTLALSALDASGNIVLLSSSAITWTSATTSVATVSSAGVVTGVAAGTSVITATDSESGKTVSVTVTVSAASSSASIVDLSNAYINSLSSTQQALTVVANTAANAAKWSNLPATPTSDGTNSLRNGVSYSTLTTAQKTAWANLVNAALAGQPLNQETQIRAADNYLSTLNSGYSGDYQYVAFVGTPSASGTWMLQIGGHHNAHNYYYTGTTLNTTTPYFLGVEPTSFTYNGTTYTPLAAQHDGMYNLISSLSTTQLASAKLSSSFNDVLLGPGQDARSNFPTGTTGRGILASSLTTAQQTLLKTAIAAWTQNSPLASTYQSLYESELSQTYVAYAGTTALASQGDYVRIDGPHVWIEFVCQNGIVIPSRIHFHTVWRDRVTDYNAAYGF